MRSLFKNFKLRSYSKIFLLLCLLVLLTACESGENILGVGEELVQAPDIKEDLRIYENDDPLQVHVVYLTVFQTPPGSLQRYTFRDINADEDYSDLDDPELPVLFQEGDLDGPRVGDYGYGLTDANATIEIRGRSTRLAEQKSYRVNLNNRLGRWLGFDKINLNKHPYDITRFRNKLAFDIIKKIDHLPSLRTKFMHVFIKDLSQGDLNADFVDYGLFTHVESIDDDYLESHGFDEDGQVYKAENFFFQMDEDIRTVTDEKYDEDDFEKIVGIENGGDHIELIDMLKDINNYFVSIDTVVTEHFEIDNYLTWLAVNILLDNRDTNTQNFMLYRPKNLENFYFLPWDYDGAFDYYNQVKEVESSYIPPCDLVLPTTGVRIYTVGTLERWKI